MSRINLREQVFNFIALFAIQLPLLYRITLWDRVFGFFYIGFLLLIPFRTSRAYLLIIAFLVGLIVDIFSNTPGIHAGACVFIMYIRDLWLGIVVDDTEDLTNINHVTIRKRGIIFYVFPLVFVHHFILFLVENGGTYLFWMLLSKSFLSAIFSFSIIFVLNYLLVAKPRRS